MHECVCMCVCVCAGVASYLGDVLLHLLLRVAHGRAGLAVWWCRERVEGQHVSMLDVTAISVVPQ